MKPAFPASPSRPPIATLYIKSGQHFMVQTFAALYSAQRCMEMLDHPDIEVTTRDDALDKKIIDYKPTPEERAWRVPEPVNSTWERFLAKATGTYVAPRAQPTRATPRTAIPRTASTPRATGEITPATIATQLNVTPQQVRAALRKLKISKPYAWQSASDINIDAIKGAMK